MPKWNWRDIDLGRFLRLAKSSEDLQIPTIGIELVWQTHMLLATSYW